VATNKALERAQAISYPAPATVVSGDPVLVGKLAGVAKTSYRSDTTEASIDHEGAYFLSVTAVTTISPAAGSAIKPGDAIYADGGTTDATTNFTTGFTLDKNSSGVFFGNALDAVTSGATATIRVRLDGKNY
jgi:predicted RecA/RadA family phage recombinase